MKIALSILVLSILQITTSFIIPLRTAPTFRLHVTSPPSRLDTDSPNQSSKGVPITFTSPLTDLSTLAFPVKPTLETIDQEKLNAYIKKQLATASKDYELLPREDFVTRGGICEGDTAVIDWTAEYVGGGEGGEFMVGSKMKGVKGTATEVDIKDSYDNSNSIWGYFSTGLLGSGQMASNSFLVTFPASYPIAKLQNVECRVTAVVKKIMYKIPKEAEDESLVTSTSSSTFLNSEIRKWILEIDEVIMSKIMAEFITIDTTKVTESVSWAKFGEKSLEKVRSCEERSPNAQAAFGVTQF
ncbi:hypothetical protein TrLO_g6076 [Triparma laevis f. longispina]|uniref:Uncharacterized protein n=1 Tax=Triparma laevis f. longispina TaxID=1714387 RepID=A0A9W7CJC9_9STRA|nr:hypothetical protein TrLO_g6076 [Triparma laevis f. longispina]